MSRPLKRREFVTLLKIFITRWVAKILLLFVFDFKWFILENIWFIFATLQIQNMWNASCDLFLFCSIHTVRKSQIQSKNSIFRKISKLWICFFVPKMNWFSFSTFKEKSWFLARKFKFSWILDFKKNTIFGAKIHIIHYSLL